MEWVKGCERELESEPAYIYYNNSVELGLHVCRRVHSLDVTTREKKSVRRLWVVQFFQILAIQISILIYNDIMAILSFYSFKIIQK